LRQSLAINMKNSLKYTIKSKKLFNRKADMMVMNNILIRIEKLEKREERQAQALMKEADDKRLNMLRRP